MWPEVDGLGNFVGARLRISDQGEDFETFRLRWNGTHRYAELNVTGNCGQYDLPNDWDCVEVFLPSGDFNQPDPVRYWSNEGLVWFTTDADPQVLILGSCRVVGNAP
jgi:hypothetical protein